MRPAGRVRPDLDGRVRGTDEMVGRGDEVLHVTEDVVVEVPVGPLVALGDACVDEGPLQVVGIPPVGVVEPRQVP